MNSIKRVKVVKWLLSIVFFAFFVYIFILQTIYSKKYAYKAEKQHCDSIPLIAERGKILDFNNRPIVYNKICASVRVLPQYVRCCDSVANLLAVYNIKSKEEIAQELKKNTHLFWLSKYIDYDVSDKLKKELKRRQFDNSVIIADDSKRIYPFGATSGSITGFMGDDKGFAGIEFYYDNILRGTPGWIILQKDAIGNDYYWPSYPKIQPVDGFDIILTVDLEIQEIAYQKLAQYVDSFQAIRGSVIVIDADNGAILAMCDYPDFDPQNYKDYAAKSWTASSICDEFEPGSVYKLIICATALEAKNADLLMSQKYDVSKGFIGISGKKIKDVHNNGIIDFNDIFIKSSNIGVSMLSQMISAEDFFLMERRFGFGLPTGIELPGEANGYLDRPKFLTQLRLANNAFGQGVRATLLQLSMAYLSIADGGVLLKPYIVKEINNNGKTLYYGGKKTVRRVLDENHAMMIKDILARVVTEGTGRAAALDEYQVCGKTGTAQKLEPDGKYSSKKSMMSFIGFFPQEKPKYLIAVLVDEPKISRFAGEVTCPLFRDIAVKMLRLKGPNSLQPDKNLVIR